MIVFVTTGVVVLTLVVQGLALTPVIRWARLTPDDTTGRELRLAQRTTIEEALAALPELATRHDVPADATAVLRHEYEQHLALVADEKNDGAGDLVQEHQRMVDLRLALVARKRQTAVHLRDERVIDDTVLRQVQARLDLEELRLTGPTDVE